MTVVNVNRPQPAISWKFAGLMLCLGLLCSTATPAVASGDSGLEGVSFSAKGYFDYSNGKSALPGGEQSDFNRFALTRGYFTFKKKVNDWMTFRLTMDIHQDDTGDYKRREKYYYAELRPGDAGLLTNMRAEIGMGHMPWLDFEEHINVYRSQGTMAIERAGVFNSADLGASLRGYFGCELEDAKENTGNKNYAGQFGSWHVGIYNGPGYHAEEANQDKVLEGRLTLRPLPEVLPGLQLSGLGIVGKGNSLAEEDVEEKGFGGHPDYVVALGMLSFEHPLFTVTGQFFTTEGNAKGAWIDPATGDSLKTAGYSGYADIRIAGQDGRWNLFGRLDHFDGDKDDVIATETAYDMILGGLVYHVHKDNLLMLVFEKTTYEDNFVGKKKKPSGDPVDLGDEEKIQVVYQIKI